MATPSRPRVSLPERYSITRHVADGGMASVWEAQDERLGRSVAVKVLSPSLAADDAARRRFTREARAAARLSMHPHVVTVYDAGEHDGVAFLVMALYPGGTVGDRIKAGPVARAQALDWLEDAAGALDLAHGEGVVHRDVKPANLLLDANDRVAVADFGIATAAWETSMTQTGMVLGTIAYLAPEQRTGGVATPASDRYALGVVARELLTGARPGVEATHPVALSGAAEIALARATAEDPDARPASCVALVRELEIALDAPDDRTAATRAVAPRPRAAALPVAAAGVAGAAAGGGAAGAGGETAVARTPRPPRAPVAASSSQPPHRDGVGAKALTAFAVVVALLIGVGVALAASGGDDAGAGAETQASASSTAKKAQSTPTKSAAEPPVASTTTPPAPAPTPTAGSSQSAPTPGPATKSKAQLSRQNDAARRATRGDPAGQIAPLQESVAGLCVDESDLRCAFALFNLAQALRLAGRPGEAIPLLERRLSISDNQVPAVEQELAAARAAAGGDDSDSSSDGSGSGGENGKAKGKKDG